MKVLKMTLRPAFKVFGGKKYLAKWIISHFPANYEQMNYLEPYVGAGSLFLNKNPSIEETVNDLDPGVIAIFKALRDQPEEFIARLKFLKYSEKTFNNALSFKGTSLDYTVNEFVLRRMSRSGLKKAFSWSDRKRGGQPGDVNAWKTALNDVLPKVAERLKSVYILNKPAIEIIDKWSNPNTFLYGDPPYLHETRVSKNAYDFEMTEADHIELAKVLNRFRGKAIISGYSSDLYDELYKDWRMESKKIANHASQSKTKKIKTEQIWCNF